MKSKQRVAYYDAYFQLVIAVLLVLSSLPSMEAQVAGRISGYVRDPSGAGIPGASITVVSSEQTLKRTARSVETGFYNLLAMPAGTYRITVEASGFETQIQESVRLTLGESLRLDIPLKLGQVATEVTVLSTATLVDTTSQTLSGLVDDRRVQDLPLNGRNVMALARILPGALNVRAPQEMSNTRDGSYLSVNGSRAVANNFTLNGANFTSFAQTTGMNYPPPDAVQEIRIQTHNFTSEYGNNAGSQISVTTKSGTNQFHGSAWEFLRNDKLNARSFFQTRRPTQRQNQAGVAAGGPILKNRLFAFGSYQRLWNRPESGSTQAFVPSEAERRGDFSASGVTLTNPTDPITNDPFTNSFGGPCVAGNVINPTCISPAAQNYLDQYVPTSPSGVIVALAPTPRGNYTWLTRIDFLQSSNLTLYGHFFTDHYDQTYVPGTIKGYTDASRATETYDASFNSTYTFSPSFLSETVFSYLRSNSFQGTNQRIPPRSMGINLDEGPTNEGAGIDVSGRFNLSFPGPAKQDYYNWHFKQSMSKISGRHTFKWGYEMMYIDFHLGFASGRNFTFTGSRSGDPTADFLLGAFDRLTYITGFKDSDPVAWKHMFYFQDEFKIVPRFTLTYGVRYEPMFPWKQKFGHYTSSKPGVTSMVKPDSPPGILFPGDPGVPEKTVKNDMNNFGPRLGFAWDVIGDGKTSVRGGYGIFFDQISANSVHAAEAPWVGDEILFDGLLDDPFGSLNLTPPPSTLPGTFGCSPISEFPGLECSIFPLPVRFVSREVNLRTPYIQSWNLTLERQLRRDVMVEASYVGKATIKAEGHRHWNPAVYMNSPITGKPPSSQNTAERVLYPETRGIILPTSRILGNDFRSWYHGLQLKVDKRFSSGFSLLGSYVLSKRIDNILNSSPGNTPGNSNPFNLRDDMGRGDVDRRHVVAITWVWNPPVALSNSLANTLLSGWTITGFHSIQSGPPLTFVMGTDIALDGTGGGSRQHAQLAPEATVETITVDHANRDEFVHRFFNTDAFVPIKKVPKGIYGNAGRGILSGPADSSSDFAVMKDFRLREPLKVQFRTELFNAFNQVNFSNPNTRVASGSFGRITSAGSGRVIQLALKLLW